MQSKATVTRRLACSGRARVPWFGIVLMSPVTSRADCLCITQGLKSGEVRHFFWGETRLSYALTSLREGRQGKVGQVSRDADLRRVTRQNAQLVL